MSLRVRAVFVHEPEVVSQYGQSSGALTRLLRSRYHVPLGSYVHRRRPLGDGARSREGGASEPIVDETRVVREGGGEEPGEGLHEPAHHALFGVGHPRGGQGRRAKERGFMDEGLARVRWTARGVWVSGVERRGVEGRADGRTGRVSAGGNSRSISSRRSPRTRRSAASRRTSSGPRASSRSAASNASVASRTAGVQAVARDVVAVVEAVERDVVEVVARGEGDGDARRRGRGGKGRRERRGGANAWGAGAVGGARLQGDASSGSGDPNDAGRNAARGSAAARPRPNVASVAADARRVADIARGRVWRAWRGGAPTHLESTRRNEK